MRRLGVTTSCRKFSLWLWVPAFAGTTAQFVAIPATQFALARFRSVNGDSATVATMKITDAPNTQCGAL
ncbi:hypothetical protein SAMN05216573_101429 [Bradyrhizobium sp. Rc3b]|nr:hypothetical protein SAMN05216573_101429 [Bradyrhizobium sp. Rc3b]